MRGLLLALATLLAGVAHADPNALWQIVSQRCVPNARDHGQPSPCALVDLANGYVILKDLVGSTQFLLIPTARVTGIEDKALLAPGAPNYFAEAWHERHFTSDAARRALRRDALSLAINSVYGRTQNQLHIHIDCVAPTVRDAIARNIAAIGDGWASFPEPLAGHRYRAHRVAGDGLAGFDPFTGVADGVPGARAAMDRETIVVVGAILPGGAPGFVVFSDAADPSAGDRGSGEELQDHSCALARRHAGQPSH